MLMSEDLGDARLGRHGGEQEVDGCLIALDGILSVALGERCVVRDTTPVTGGKRAANFADDQPDSDDDQ
jgi:hypothetical protein